MFIDLEILSFVLIYIRLILLLLLFLCFFRAKKKGHKARVLFYNLTEKKDFPTLTHIVIWKIG